MNKQKWVAVCQLQDIPELGARVVQTDIVDQIDRVDIAVFRNKADEVFALQDRCPHKGGPLSQGIVHGRSVTCPLHSWCVGLADGNACEPDEGHTPAYETRVNSDGMVELLIGPNG